MLTKIRLKIEQILYRQNFYSPSIRYLLFIQIVTVAVSLIIGILFSQLTLWPLVFSIGSILSLFSFWHIAHIAQDFLRYRFSIKMALQYFFMFNIRLLIVGAVLFLFIVLLQLPVVPLLAGLTSSVAIILLWVAGVTAKIQFNSVKEV